MTHLGIGLVLACAPVGGWVAITGRLDPFIFLLGGAVLFWVAGFDVIYACQDVSSDQALGLHSLPARFGIARALLCSKGFHLLSILSLVGVGVFGALGVFFWIGLGLVSFILLMEHRIISSHDLSRVNQAFFVMNGWVSVLLFLAILFDRIWLG